MEYKRVYAQIDLDNIANNMSAVRKHVKKDTKVMAVVKANGYGHGALEVSKTALYNGADYLGVAICEEGIWLRENNIHEPILILGYTPEAQNGLLAEYGLIQTVFSEQSAQAVSRAAVKHKKRVAVHIKIDTGMSRLGFLPDRDSVDAICRITSLPNIDVEGIYSHFATSSSEESTRMQLCAFIGLLDRLKQRGIEPPLKHVSNSGALISYPDMHMDMVRAGILLYGLQPHDGAHDIGLKPAMSLKTQISLIKTLPAGVGVGYGSTYHTSRETQVATVPVGYADGYSRDMANRGRVLVHGEYAHVIGAICMDQFMIDVTGIDGVKPGDPVTLFGTDGERSISVDELAAIQNTINYEIVCGIGKRVPRVYVKNGSVIKIEE